MLLARHGRSGAFGTGTFAGVISTENLVILNSYLKEMPMREWIAELFENPDLTKMGHGQRVEDLNLGLGWLYYSLARIVRPTRAVVIGSYRGFAPLVLGKALADNSEGGQVFFIDPSFVDDFWKDSQAVNDYFTSFGVTNIWHFLMTTQQFVESEGYSTLDQVGLVFVDGYHSEEQARFDYEAFEGLLAPGGVILFHDSVRVRQARLYGVHCTYEHRVKCFIDKLKGDPTLQIFDLPFAAGVTLVRKDNLGITRDESGKVFEEVLGEEGSVPVPSMPGEEDRQSEDAV